MGKKPFTKSEMKILIYNKIQRGMTYNDACKQLESEIKAMNKTNESTSL